MSAVIQSEPVLLSRSWAVRLLTGLLCLLVLAACDSVEERADKHYENGMALLEDGKPVKASLEFRNAVKLNDSHVGANLELAKIYQDQDNFSAAVFQYRKVVELDATQAEAHIKLAQIMLAFNEVDEAVSHTVAAVQLSPDNVEVVMLEAVIAIRVEDFDKAREKADRAIEMTPNNGDAWLVLAALARREESDEKALEITREAERRDPENMRVVLFLVNLLGQMRENDELGKALRRLTELKPEELSFWDSLARWQLNNKAWDDIEVTLRKVSDLAPDDTDRQLDLVRLMAATQGQQAAINELARLIELRKDTDAIGQLEMAMAEVEIQLGRREDAERRLRRVIATLDRLEEVVLTARVTVARLRLIADDREGAKTLIDEALAIDATHAKSLTMRGRLAILREDYDAAIRDLRAAEAEAPEDVETLRLLAVAHERNGSKDLAAERLAAAVEASDHGVEPVLEYTRHLLSENRDEAAENVVTDALQKRRGNVRLLDALARIKLRRRDFSGTERIARALQSREETEELGDRLMAAALAGQDRFDETIKILEAGTEEGTNRAGYLSALVATHLRNDDLPAATELVEKALLDNPEDSNAVRLKATLAMVNRDPEAAGDLFRRAVFLGPNVPMNHLSLYRFHVQRGEVDIAEKAIRAGIDETDSGILRLNLAMLLERSGKIGEAIEQYQVLYERQPESEVIANNLASLMTDNDPTEADIDRAFVIAKRLRDTEVPHFKDTYGWLMFLRGDHEGAYVHLKEAAEKLPDNPVVQYHLGMVLAELGETDRAKDALTRALELAGERPVPQIEGAQAKLDSLSGKATPETAAE